jgi:hypothetical protein
LVVSRASIFFGISRRNFARPAALPVITSTARTVNAQGPPALTAPGVAQPDSISVELHGRAAPANMVPELITVAVVSAVMPVMGH